MSLLQDMTYISLTTSKVSAIRMLNAVIICMGYSDLINADDDHAAILGKIECEEGGGLLRISIPDLLDEEAMKDGQLQKKYADYAAKKEAKASSCYEDDEDCFDETTDAEMIDIVDVIPNNETYEIKFELYECEGCPYYSDWCDWGDIVRVYGGRVLMDNDLYSNGRFEVFCGTTIWMEENGEVREERISPLLDIGTYIQDFDRLLRLDPDRYHQRYIESLEESIRTLQRCIEMEKEKELSTPTFRKK